MVVLLLHSANSDKPSYVIVKGIWEKPSYILFYLTTYYSVTTASVTIISAMGSIRKRTKKKPIASSSSTSLTSSVSHKVTRSTITAFHVLLRKKANITKKVQHAATDSEKSLWQKELDAVNNNISELGGLDAYQRASQLGQSKDRGGDSSRILVSWLLEMGIKKDRPLRWDAISYLTRYVPLISTIEC